MFAAWIQALDISLCTGPPSDPLVLHQIAGDVSGERSYVPQRTSIDPGKSVQFAPSGGRSSNGVFPFFNIQYGTRGFITAIGWSGQWATTLSRSASGTASLIAGMERTHLRLHSGERIRSPRILVLPWKGDRGKAHNRFRRLMLEHYTPQVSGTSMTLPLALQCFDRYSYTRPDWVSEAEQLKGIGFAKNAGLDTFWVDAIWFRGGFPKGVGNWSFREGFPNGLKPLGEACKNANLKFVVWFEPERVAGDTEVAREHPEFVFGGKQGGLFKLNEPAARKWLTGRLSESISNSGLNIYRNDFNMDPLQYWRDNDTTERQGMTEIRYVDGLYAMWDELLGRHPGLLIDNCASGGRRIDIETCIRSVPLWRSDTGCFQGNADWDQTQSSNLSMYVPLNAAGVWSLQAYDVRSAATAGTAWGMDYLNPSFSLKEARIAISEVKENQKYWLGDLYQLTACSAGAEEFVAWQLNRADLQSGIVLAFRRNDCRHPGLIVSPFGINRTSSYRVEYIDESRRKTERIIAGAELEHGLELRIDKPNASLLVRYAVAR